MRKKTKICLGCLREISLYDSVCPFCGFDPIKVKSPRYLRAGTRLLDRYLVGRELGEGGFGITYVGYDTRQKRPVAVKEYFPAHIASRDTTSGRSQDVICFDGKDGKFFQSGLERFKKEGKTLEKASSCDSVVQVYDYLEENKTAYIVMEYVPGITVQQRVERQGIFTPEEMLLVVEPLMNDLQKLHEKGMLYRDISPDNIILRPDGVAKLVDFGSARRTVLDAKGNNKSMTVVVRQQYTPKEQYSRNGKQGPWTDIYSLAATMYFMLTGKAPVSALEREAEAANQKMQAGMQLIKASLADVLEEAMALNPDDRYADMQSFYEALKKKFRYRKAQSQSSGPFILTGKKRDESFFLSGRRGVSIWRAQFLHLFLWWWLREKQCFRVRKKKKRPWRKKRLWQRKRLHQVRHRLLLLCRMLSERKHQMR